VPVGHHAARNLTAELADQAAMIFCMTSAHREALISMIPSAATKAYCLDSKADVADPIGQGMQAYIECARQIQRLVRLRFDQMALWEQFPA
jgi:protein-tyrosine-phosphatase